METQKTTIRSFFGSPEFDFTSALGEIPCGGKWEKGLRIHLHQGRKTGWVGSVLGNRSRSSLFSTNSKVRCTRALGYFDLKHPFDGKHADQGDQPSEDTSLSCTLEMASDLSLFFVKTCIVIVCRVRASF